jgi:rare lipoprotein A (peptidoglycan hydrolase)
MKGAWATSPNARCELSGFAKRNNVSSFSSRLAVLIQIVLLSIAPLSFGQAQASVKANANAKVAAASQPLASPPGRRAATQKNGAKRAALAHGKNKAAHTGMSGTAAYYANRFHGRKTSSGHLYDKNAMTAAHRSIPLGTWVRVTHQRNGSSVVVQVNDRGPFAGKRIIDLSLAAATELGMLRKGTAPVLLEVLPNYPPAIKAEASSDDV